MVVPLSVRMPINVEMVEMSNFIKKFVGTSSNTSSSRIDEQLRQIQENTQKYENKLSVSIEDWEQYIKNWEMPKQNIKELYKIGTFEFKKDYIIKISENTHSIGSKTETIELLDPKDLEQIKKEKFKILHIGAIQVAAKPLTRLGLDKPICIYLRDVRHNQFQDSLLGLMQANTYFGPVYFTCYPNLELDCMNDKSIHKTLTLNIQTQNYDMDPRSKNILIVYRVYYKVMTSVVNPNCLLSSPKDQTLIWQANEKNSTVIIPKLIPWECLTQSQEWNFKQLLASKPIEQPKLISIIKDGQGNVQINFEPRKENLTRSYSARSSNSFLEIRTHSRRSNVQSNLNLEEVDYSSTILDLKYLNQIFKILQIGLQHILK